MMHMQTGQVIYGIEGRRNYAFAALSDTALFSMGADIDQLLADVIQEGDGSIGPDDLNLLPLVDYEFLQAHFYIAHFGDLITRNMDCPECKKKYAVDFSLRTFLSLVAEEMPKDEGREFQGATFRLPCRATLSDAGGDPAHMPALLWKGDGDTQAFEDHLAKLCPLIEEDVQTNCPRCETGQSYRFSLRGHLGERLSARMRHLVAEIHILASQYHWSAPEILALSRESRRALIDTIQQQRQRARRAS
jgi:hypothetical protein